jgi:sortase A
MSTPARLLLWLELALLAIGVSLAAWCAVAIVEARYYRALPIPAAAAAALPGEAPAPSRRAPDGDIPKAGTTTRVAVGGWIARLEAPSVHLSATVLEGSDDGTLAHGAGHIEDTAFPGDPGNFGIAGHRDTTFRPVRHLHAGDPLIVTTAGEVFRYRITKTMIVDPEDVYVLDNADHPTLTLVTCYPFEFIGHAPRRFIVSADLVGASARAGGR